MKGSESTAGDDLKEKDVHEEARAEPAAEQEKPDQVPEDDR
jgi:hypothetical protein